MNRYKQFNLATSELSGVNLIEASAGTGKTYTIAGIYLRLIIESGVPVESILVVTFTDAATQELKERIRARLKDAVKCFEKGHSDDPLMDGLLQNSDDSAATLELLRESLRNFDQAAIYTIHGFCQRMLVENAFESGSLFETELVGSSSDLIETILKDFWRINIYAADPVFIQWLSEQRLQPLSFLSFVRNGLKQGVKITPGSQFNDIAEYEAAYSDDFERCRDVWLLERSSVSEIFLNNTAFNGNKYRKNRIPLWLSMMDTYFQSELTRLSLPDCFEKFTSEFMEKPGSMKKGMAPPQNLFFDACNNLFESFEQLDTIIRQNLLWYKLEAISYAERQLELRKQKQGITGFDDLLINLYKGLKGKNGGRLSENIRRKYSVALIDEFQDTDPVQYEIFFRIFGNAGSTMFMIGDPKQAIYSFRGADIFAYMNAAKDADNAYTLSNNYRSEPEIIEAVNTIFKNGDNPFVFDEIEFLPVAAAGIDDTLVSGIEDEYSFFNIWQIESEKVMSKQEASDFAPQIVASEILRLLALSVEGRANAGGRQIKANDMAVLVRTNNEAQTMKEVLNNYGIPAVVYSTGNVFHSETSVDLNRVLTAVIKSGNDDALKAALVTDLIGYTGEDIAAFEEDPGLLDKVREKWTAYYKDWLKFGFIRMFNEVMKNEKILIKLMSFRDGERKNTNLLHLSQLLHKASVEKKFGPEMLIKWFREQCDPAKGENDEHQLRLESDSESIRIVTIHKSKGMEYPIVFCPYVWSGRVRRASSEFCIFHDENDSMALTMDTGSEDFSENINRAEREGLAEDLRVLYVALTRAKNRCYIIWGRVKGAENTAFAHLLYNGKKPKTDMDVKTLLEGLATNSNGAIHISSMPDLPISGFKEISEVSRSISLNAFIGHIDTGYRIASFSSMTANQHQIENADRDSGANEKQKMEADIFSFPRGAGPGTFMHSIFEHLDFTTGPEQKEILVKEKLDEYGYSDEWQETILKMVENVLKMPLDNHYEKFKLLNVANTDRINELEFYFPLKKVKSDELNSLLEKNGVGCSADIEKAAWNLEFSTVKGFMKGFIDLIFRSDASGTMQYYIADWKSNWLGNSVGDYNAEGISTVMMKEYYILQYLLYTVALNRYLQLKMEDAYNYDTHFGGVYYIFLRGVEPQLSSDAGIFYDKPEYELIQDLTTLLLEEL